MIPTLKIVPIKDVRKKGWSSIYLQYTFNRKVNRISLKISIPENSWQGTDQYVKHRGKDSLNNARNINKHLGEILIKAQNIIFSWDDTFPHSFSLFKSKLIRNKPISFFEYHNLYINEQRKKDLREITFSAYTTHINRILRYQDNLLLSEINEAWILKFEHTMRTEWNLDVNSIYRVMIHMRAILNLAKKNGDIASNPFEFYEVKKAVKEKLFLSIDELSLLEKTYESCILRSSLQNVLEQFLFACYTGLAFADLKKLTFQDIKKIDNTLVITGVRQKSRNDKPLRFVIPLIDRAASMLDSNKETGAVFEVISNQKMNQYIKEVCKTVGIFKNVTFHTARHTCGTALINLGVPKHVVQQILGHKNSEMTDHYAKIVDTTVIDQMKILNKKWK